MEPIKCPNCGKINDGSTDFCIYCGTIYEEYNAEDDDSNIFFIPTRSGKRQEVKFNPMPEQIGKKKQSYTIMILIGYIFAILGSVLGFIFAFYLITRKDSTAKKHGIIQLVLLIIEFGIFGFLILTGQIDPNILLNPFNTTQMANMTNMSQNMSGSNNLSSLFGF